MLLSLRHGDNTEGSFRKFICEFMPITNSREIRALRNSIALSERQRRILTGSLLGDGCLILNSWKKQYRFQVEQNEAHKDYVYWLYEEFKDFVLSEPTYHPLVRSWKFRTISHPDFTEVASRFYAGRIKILPKEIGELLNNPLTLAIWAMDDGCLMPQGSGFTFNTQSFTLEENKKLQECLAKNFGLDFTSLHKDKTRVRLYVKKVCLDTLHDLLEKHFLQEFTYKLPKAP